MTQALYAHMNNKTIIKKDSQMNYALGCDQRKTIKIEKLMKKKKKRKCILILSEKNNTHIQRQINMILKI
jgi:hypothetical protein